MIVSGNISKVRKVIKEAKRRNKLVGFVPTMGALHAGHMSLVKRAKKECSFVVVSIFLNPTQFGPGQDLRRYPKCFAKDTHLLRRAGIDLLFYPRQEAMYQRNHSVYVQEDSLSKGLCGKFRPGHFRGVCTVVGKLFNIVEPDIAYFGQKDYQQALILKRLVRDLNFSLKIKILPIIREKDKLALSSRNSYLSPGERTDALSLYSSLREAKSLIKKGERNPRKIINEMKRIILSKKGVKIEYIKIVDAQNLKELDKIRAPVLIALAVYIGKTRLIDNVIINVKG
ncbi:MAG: pantoate--beta-alanine ligase [Candidatus Omnitrophota bacterium]|nr:MAG: pantoate--beta-alanine ligase [Candidatus Omnitrophota bacterium]